METNMRDVDKYWELRMQRTYYLRRAYTRSIARYLDWKPANPTAPSLTRRKRYHRHALFLAVGRADWKWMRM